LLKTYLGDFFYNDFLHIKDFSAELGKKHSLKIELDTKNESSKTLASDFQYQDRGIREINSRLQQSFIGKMKVVLIENIERIVPAAANAFLKTCEEPLPHRLIIATTSHASQLIDTIISRALVIHFNELSPKELLAFADEQKMFPDHQELKELVCDMAMGKPGILIQLHDLLSDDDVLKQQFKDII
jgi:DNA polymerase III delta prime subunit